MLVIFAKGRRLCAVSIAILTILWPQQAVMQIVCPASLVPSEAYQSISQMRDAGGPVLAVSPSASSSESVANSPPFYPLTEGLCGTTIPLGNAWGTGRVLHLFLTNYFPSSPSDAGRQFIAVQIRIYRQGVHGESYEVYRNEAKQSPREIWRDERGNALAGLSDEGGNAVRIPGMTTTTWNDIHIDRNLQDLGSALSDVTPADHDSWHAAPIIEPGRQGVSSWIYRDSFVVPLEDKLSRVVNQLLAYTPSRTGFGQNGASIVPFNFTPGNKDDIDRIEIRLISPAGDLTRTYLLRL